MDTHDFQRRTVGNDLHARFPVGRGIHAAQHFMPGRERLDGRAELRQFDVPLESHSGHDRVRLGRGQLVNEPQTPLCGRHRQSISLVRASSHCRPVGRRRCGGDLAQAFGRRRFKQRSERQVRAESFTDPSDHSRREQ